MSDENRKCHFELNDFLPDLHHNMIEMHSLNNLLLFLSPIIELILELFFHKKYLHIYQIHALI